MLRADPSFANPVDVLPELQGGLAQPYDWALGSRGHGANMATPKSGCSVTAALL